MMTDMTRREPKPAAVPQRHLNRDGREVIVK